MSRRGVLVFAPRPDEVFLARRVVGQKTTGKAVCPFKTKEIFAFGFREVVDSVVDQPARDIDSGVVE